MRRLRFKASVLAVFAAIATFGAAACSNASADPPAETAPDAALIPEVEADATVGPGERPRRDTRWLGGEDARARPPTGPLPELAAFASSWYSTCAIGVDGSLWCWGSGSALMLGWFYDGIIEDPLRVDNATDWATVALGEQAACAVKTNGSLWCWGRDVAALGVGGPVADAVIEPFQVGSDYDWKLVRVGLNYGCGLKTNGELWCWGKNQDGQLGLGIDDSSYVAGVPVRAGSARWKALAVNGNFSPNVCGIQVDGSLWCWGAYPLFSDFTQRSSPERIGTASDWVEVEGGYDAFCAIREDRSLWCWGDNTYQQVGSVGDPWEPMVHVPRQVMAGKTWQSVRAGDWYACAVDTASALWCWGNGQSGKLGNGSTDRMQLPSRVGAESDWSLYGGTGPLSSSLCAKRGDGPRWCWGNNTSAQLGDGTRDNSLVPKPIP